MAPKEWPGSTSPRAGVGGRAPIDLAEGAIGRLGGLQQAPSRSGSTIHAVQVNDRLHPSVMKGYVVRCPQVWRATVACSARRAITARSASVTRAVHLVSYLARDIHPIGHEFEALSAVVMLEQASHAGTKGVTKHDDVPHAERLHAELDRCEVPRGRWSGS